MTVLFLRRSEERGLTRNGWLESRHSFSFGNYVDPRHRHFGALQVINEDSIKPDTGFGMHPHDNMEILTVLLTGTLKHVDTLGHTQTLRPGDVQHITAGKGISHAEYNSSLTEPVHLLQIWIQPRKKGLPPRYTQKHFFLEPNKLIPLVGKGGLQIQQDAQIWRGVFTSPLPLRHKPLQASYLLVIRGELSVEKEILKTGDAVGIAGPWEAKIQKDSDLLVIDVPRRF